MITLITEIFSFTHGLITTSDHDQVVVVQNNLNATTVVSHCYGLGFLRAKIALYNGTLDWKWSDRGTSNHHLVSRR